MVNEIYPQERKDWREKMTKSPRRKRMSTAEQALREEMAEIERQIAETEGEHDRIMARLDTLVGVKGRLEETIGWYVGRRGGGGKKEEPK